VGREVEGDGKPFLPGGEVAAIKALDSLAVEKPAYWRMVHGCAVYMVARGPRT
jgi:hypothetical protein